MRSSRHLFSNQGGGVSIFLAGFLVLSLAVLGVTIDLARAYLVRNKLQEAIDASLLGAVASAGTIPAECNGNTLCGIQLEMENLFHANYPDNYMGSAVANLVVRESSPGIYRIEANATIPNTIMPAFGYDQISLALISEVQRGFQNTPVTPPEITLVVDVFAESAWGNKSGSSGGEIKTSTNSELKKSISKLVGVLYGHKTSIDGFSISIVPYNTMVNIDNDVLKLQLLKQEYIDKLQGYYNVYKVDQIGLGNRIGDEYTVHTQYDPPWATPPYAGDLTDAPPFTEDTKFIVPPDVTYVLPLKFAMQEKQEVINMVNALTHSGSGPGGNRLNVGLLWGWMTLSPQWRGLWNNTQSLPRDYSPSHPKIMIVMPYIQNASLEQNNPNLSAALCEEIKRKGILIYVVSFGDIYARDLLRNCASEPTMYFEAFSSDDFTQAFTQIGDDIVYRTLRITE